MGNRTGASGLPFATRAMSIRLRMPYQRALTRIPAIASGLLSGGLTELELRVILAACASAQGLPLIGEAITELTPKVMRRFLEERRYE